MAKTYKNKYQTHVLPRLKAIEGWKKRGVSEEDIAKNLGIAYSTFNEYKKKYLELSEALKFSHDDLVIVAENSLVERMLESDTLLIFFLKSRAGYLEEQHKVNHELKKLELKNKQLESELELERMKNNIDRNNLVDEIFSRLKDGE